jgi:MarR family transcriptional regulator, organic hydroperoxide resistance regulator
MTDKSATVAELTDNLRRIFQVVNEQSKKIEQESGLTGPQLWTIKVMADTGPVKISELARRMYLHPATVGGILDRLEVKELILRTRSRQDRRVVRVTLTSQGNNLVASSPEVVQGVLVTGLVRLPVERLENIAAGLEDIVHILDVQGVPPRLLLSTEVNRPQQVRSRPKKKFPIDELQSNHE